MEGDLDVMSRTRQAHLVDTRSAGNLSGLLSSHAGGEDSAAFGEAECLPVCLPTARVPWLH